MPANVPQAMRPEVTGAAAKPDVDVPVDVSVGPGSTIVDEVLAEAKADDWKARGNVLKTELEAETDRARSGMLAYELGEVIERRLKNEPDAVKAYGRALKDDTKALKPNLWAIRRVFHRRGLWPNLLKLADAEIRFAQSDAERARAPPREGQRPRGQARLIAPAPRRRTTARWRSIRRAWRRCSVGSGSRSPSGTRARWCGCGASSPTPRRRRRAR